MGRSGGCSFPRSFQRYKLFYSRSKTDIEGVLYVFQWPSQTDIEGVLYVLQWPSQTDIEGALYVFQWPLRNPHHNEVSIFVASQS